MLKSIPEVNHKGLIMKLLNNSLKNSHLKLINIAKIPTENENMNINEKTNIKRGKSTMKK